MDTGSQLDNFPITSNKYEILGVDEKASLEEIKIAYRRMALLYHPDHHSDENREQAQEIFKQVSSAYRTLSTEQERRRYDRSLRSGEEFRESSGDNVGISLAEILGEIQEYEHIFTEDQLITCDARLRDAVKESLIHELNEQIVGVYRMTEAPTGATYQGNYKAGAVVLTNIRVLLPFIYEWEETSGNTKTKYTGISMPGYPLPLITRFVIVSKRRIRPRVEVRIEQQQGQTKFVPGQCNLAKLLLLARFWGIRVESMVVESRFQELRSAIMSPLAWAAGGSLVLIIIAAVVGFFTDDFIETPTRLVTYFEEKGIWRFMILGCAVLASRGILRWGQIYLRADPATVLESITETADPGSSVIATEANG